MRYPSREEKKDKKAKAFVPTFPGMMPPKGGKKGKKSRKAKAKKLSAGTKSFMQKNIDMRKVIAENAKETYGQLFAYMIGLQEGLDARLPDKAPSIPGMPAGAISPKDLAMSMKEFRESANEHFVEQMDSRVDFIIQSQQKLVDMIPGQAEVEEEIAEELEDEAVEEIAEDEVLEEEVAEEELAEIEEATE